MGTRASGKGVFSEQKLEKDHGLVNRKNESKPIRYLIYPKAGMNQLESIGSSDSKDEGQQCCDMQN